MLKSLTCLIVGLALLCGLPSLQAQPFQGKGLFRLLSSYHDDPSVAPSVVKWLSTAEVGYTPDGRRVLRGPQVRILDEPKIYRKNSETGRMEALAWNPWPEPGANAEGEFTFPGEDRFPFFKTERDPNGSIARRDGLQVWIPQDLHLGMDTAFGAAVAVKAAAEQWAGRQIRWGEEGVLEMNAHSFVDFQAIYAPSLRMIFFGVLPYRPPDGSETRLFETASSWELAAHESGHAVHHALKPNVDLSRFGYKSWGESFGDQTAMWTSLRDSDRARELLAAAQGDLNSSNALTKIGEMYGYLVKDETSVRDAFNDKKISDTEEEEHDRSEPLTGAVYQIFVNVYNQLKAATASEVDALRKAADIMGIFQARATDYTPESDMTLEDVAKAYLTVDKELFEGRYHDMLVNEFLKRELLQPNSVRDWLAREADLPRLHVPREWTDRRIEAFIGDHLSDLGIGPEFGLALQNVVRATDSGISPLLCQTIVRVQLTRGRGEQATPLENHGVLVFRASGTLADYHSPLPGDAGRPRADYFAQAKAVAAADNARFSIGGVRPVAPVALVRLPNGEIAAESRIIRGQGLDAHMDVFTPANPQGERREIIVPPIPPKKAIRMSEDLLQ